MRPHYLRLGGRFGAGLRGGNVPYRAAHNPQNPRPYTGARMAVAAIVYGRTAAVPNATTTSAASDPNSWTRTALGAPDNR